MLVVPDGRGPDALRASGGSFSGAFGRDVIPGLEVFTGGRFPSIRMVPESILDRRAPHN